MDLHVFPIRYPSHLPPHPTPLGLRDPMDGSLPGSSIHGIFQARVSEWVAIAFSISMHTYISIFVKIKCKYMGFPW